MEKDYYRILGVAVNADSETIKKAFRKLAKQYHPDMNGKDAQVARKFQEINEAYSILGEDAKRKAYDRQRFGRRQKTEEPCGQKKESRKEAQMDFTNVSSQFASFFGFNPR